MERTFTVRPKTILAADGTSNVVIQYHGGALGNNQFFRDRMVMKDLGLHCGSLEQAESHASSGVILEVKFRLENVVTVQDQNDWNNVLAVSNILQAAGVDASLKAVIELLRESGAESWREKSQFFTNLLVENGVSVIKYLNTEDSVHDTCYCIVDPEVIISISRYVPDDTEFSQNLVSQYSELRRFPKWVQDNVFFFERSGSGWHLGVYPLADDPDDRTIGFYGLTGDALKSKIKSYQQTYAVEYPCVRPAPDYMTIR